MRAVRKIDVAPQREFDPVDVCLALWAEWQRRDDTCVGWHRRSAMLCGDAAADSEQLHSRMETAAAEAIDVLVSCLPQHLAWAIRRQCSVATVWRFPQLDFAETLIEARAVLEKKLRVHVATRNFFV